MKIAIIGAGAMGTLFGTQLIKNTKHQIVFYDAYDSILQKNLQVAQLVTSSVEEVPIKLLDLKVVKAEVVDFIIFFVKSSMTKDTITMVQKSGMIGEKSVLLTCQGGFENPELISKFIKADQILVGCTTSFCKATGPMQITNFDVQATTAWPYKYPTNKQLQKQVIDLVKEVECLKINLTKDAVADIWKMQLYYSTNIALSAVTNISFGACYQKAESQQLLNHLADECALIAEKEKVDQSLFNKEVARKAVADLAVSCEHHMGSMHGDLAANRKTEIDGTAGALLRKAATHGVTLPFTETIWCIIRSMEQK